MAHSSLARIEARVSRSSADLAGCTATCTTSGSIQQTRRSSFPGTMVGCGIPTTAARNGGKLRTCRFPSSITLAWMTKTPTAFTAVYRTTALLWANHNTPAGSPTRSGKTCTTATASGCFRIRPIPITSMPNIKVAKSGGVTVDNSSAEMHTTIYSISESPKDKSLIWVGTDDGNLQLTRDGGKTWTNVVGNVPGLPKNSWVPGCRRATSTPAWLTQR